MSTTQRSSQQGKILCVAILGIGLSLVSGNALKAEEEESGGLKILPPPNGVYLGARAVNDEGATVFADAIGKKLAIGKPSTIIINDGGVEGTPPYFDADGRLSEAQGRAGKGCGHPHQGTTRSASKSNN